MERWKTTMELGPVTVRLLVTDEEGNEVVKARLPLRPLTLGTVRTLLEGLALWSGQPLRAAIVAGGGSARSRVALLFGPGLWPVDSALVHFDVVSPRRSRRRTLPGVGDFRQLRLLHRNGRSS